jgi:hypothetical protein
LSLLPLAGVGQVTYRRITAPEIHRAICVVTVRGKTLSPLAATFAELCVRLAGEQRTKAMLPAAAGRTRGRGTG